MRFATYSLATALLASPGLALAQPVQGVYIGGGVGVNFIPSFGGNPGFTGPSALAGTLDVDVRSGYAALGSIGWGYGNGFRAEIEFNYRNNGINLVRLGGASAGNSGGTIHSYGVMGNALYDFNPGWAVSGMGITPYLGVGVGYIINDWRNVGGRINGNARVNTDDSDGTFGYQAIAGLALGLGGMVPGLSATFEYRFLGTLSPSLNTNLLNNNAATVSSGKFEPEVFNHSVLVGLRYAFNAPRPAPAPAPVAAPAPARTFLVFFDWDRADLTDRARQIIADAARNARTVASTRIEVSGHADRTGSAAYNQRLSVRRAEAVAAELVRRGIARNEMTIQGFGFDRPLVPTAMGVREPQNRRVEIVLR